jgi:hypothetical protein
MAGVKEMEVVIAGAVGVGYVREVSRREFVRGHG